MRARVAVSSQKLAPRPGRATSGRFRGTPSVAGIEHSPCRSLGKRASKSCKSEADAINLTRLGVNNTVSPEHLAGQDDRRVSDAGAGWINEAPLSTECFPVCSTSSRDVKLMRSVRCRTTIRLQGGESRQDPENKELIATGRALVDARFFLGVCPFFFANERQDSFVSRRGDEEKKV